MVEWRVPAGRHQPERRHGRDLPARIRDILATMAQVTLYLPDKVAGRLKHAARKSGQSVSAFVTALAERELSPGKWPVSLERLYGGWEGDFIVEPDAPPNHVELP